MLKVKNNHFSYYKTYNNKNLKRGYTTGVCAAGAAKGALKMLLEQKNYSQIEIKTPNELILELNLIDSVFDVEQAASCVIKDGGDDPDATHGAKICAHIRKLPCKKGQIKIIGGIGVGVVTKPGLQIPIGEPAINPIPRKLIIDSLKEILPPEVSVEVTITVPEGEAIAKKTLNSQLGIMGGISILGTTGIVEPMSEEAFKYSLAQIFHVKKAEGKKCVALTPGRIGQKNAVNLGIAENEIIQISNYVGFMLDEAVNNGIKEILLIGHIGKLVKIAAGNFNTHNRISDGRRETMAAHAAILGANKKTIIEIMNTVTTEEIEKILRQNKLEKVYQQIANEVTKRAEAYSRGELSIGTVLVNISGSVLGYDKKATEIGGKLGWQVK